MEAARFVFHPDAADEYVDAARWYGERSAAVHDSFVAEIERALRLVVVFPNRWPPYGSRHRRVLVRRFPFSVVYLKKGGRLWVVAVVHAKAKGTVDDGLGKVGVVEQLPQLGQRRLVEK